jgi:hypothetical protein
MGSYFDRLVAITEGVDFDTHTLSHQEQQIAHVGVCVRRATAKPIVLTRFIELVSVKVPLVEVEMVTVIQAKL